MNTQRSYETGKPVTFVLLSGDDDEGACEANVISCVESAPGNFKVVVAPCDATLASGFAAAPYNGRIEPIEALPTMLCFVGARAEWRRSIREIEIREKALLDALAAVGRGIGGRR